MTPKIDGRRCTRGLFAVINPEVLHEIVGKSVWKQQFPSSIGGSREREPRYRPRGLRFSEPIERKITNHAVQSGPFLKAGWIPSDGFNRRSHKSIITADVIVCFHNSSAGVIILPDASRAIRTSDMKERKNRRRNYIILNRT